MNIIEAAHLAYDYVRTDENDKVIETNRAVSDLNLEIEAGSFVCVLGHNGSGKSTFAKLLNGLNLPTEGTVLISGKDTRDESLIWDVRKETGMVFQNPDNQIIASVVEEDVGFGPENIGIPTERIWKRVNRALESVNMTAYRLKSPNRLSGGQKQRVAIAGAMAMMPKCIVLDEPTAMLDPSGRREVLRTVLDLNRRRGVTIILITHYMEETVGADRILVMDNGELVMDGTPQEVFTEVQRLKDYRMDVPQVTELAWKLKNAGFPMPDGVLTRQEFRTHLAEILGIPAAAAAEASGAAEDANAAGRKETAAAQDSGASAAPASGEASQTEDTDQKQDSIPEAAPFHAAVDPVIRVRNLSMVYQQGTAMESYALRDVSCDIERGAFTAVVGHTGSGKSTFTQHLNGLLKASSGSIYVKFRDEEHFSAAAEVQPKRRLFGQKEKGAGTDARPLRTEDGFYDIYAPNFNMRALRAKVGLVFQYPEYQLFEVDVVTDVMFGPKNQGLSEEEARARAEEALRLVGLKEKHWKKSPFELSGGQKRRVAIAGVLAMQPEVLILDEPTAGLDPAGRDALFREIGELHEKVGMTVILVSHSMDDVARYASQVLVLDHGVLRMAGTPAEVFRHAEELRKMGLGVPQMTELAEDLRELGLPVSEEADTVDEMTEEILRIVGRTAPAGHPEDNGKEGAVC